MDNYAAALITSTKNTRLLHCLGSSTRVKACQYNSIPVPAQLTLGFAEAGLLSFGCRQNANNQQASNNFFADEQELNISVTFIILSRDILAVLRLSSIYLIILTQ